MLAKHQLRCIIFSLFPPKYKFHTFCGFLTYIIHSPPLKALSLCFLFLFHEDNAKNSKRTLHPFLSPIFPLLFPSSPEKFKRGRPSKQAFVQDGRSQVMARKVSMEQSSSTWGFGVHVGKVIYQHYTYKTIYIQTTYILSPLLLFKLNEGQCLCLCARFHPPLTS